MDSCQSRNKIHIQNENTVLSSNGSLEYDHGSYNLACRLVFEAVESKKKTESSLR